MDLDIHGGPTCCASIAAPPRAERVRRLLTPMVFFKIRASGRLEWQARSLRYERLRPEARRQ